jgi:hypothetical protein
MADCPDGPVLRQLAIGLTVAASAWRSTIGARLQGHWYGETELLARLETRGRKPL